LTVRISDGDGEGAENGVETDAIFKLQGRERRPFSAWPLNCDGNGERRTVTVAWKLAFSPTEFKVGYILFPDSRLQNIMSAIFKIGLLNYKY